MANYGENINSTAYTWKWTWRKKMYLYGNSTSHRSPQTKYLKLFWVKIFSFVTGVNDTGGAPWDANISANFLKNSDRPVWNTQELGGNWFMIKTWSQKNSWHCSFKDSFSNTTCFYKLCYGTSTSYSIPRDRESSFADFALININFFSTPFINAILAYEPWLYTTYSILNNFDQDIKSKPDR